MEKDKLRRLFILQIYFLTVICVAQCCYRYESGSGAISDYSYNQKRTKCWKFFVPDDMYIELYLTEKKFNGQNCSTSYVQVDGSSGESFTYCSGDENPRVIKTLCDVNVTFVHDGDGVVSFKMRYMIGRAVFAVKGVNASRDDTIKWLKKQQEHSFGLGKNIHRAVTALYLSGSSSFQDVDTEEELLEKETELQTIVAITRNSSNPVLMSDLSMFINALLVTCHNPRQFFGYNLLQILSEKLASSKFPSPAAYLTLCNANWALSESDAQKLLGILFNRSAYANHLDIQAMTVMALSCFKNKMVCLDDVQNAIYNATIQQIIHHQRRDGSFGNVHTTALATQALLAVNQQNSNLWKLNSTVKFLMQKLNSSIDFLSAYLTLPIFNDKSLADIADVNCSSYKEHEDHDDHISNITNKLLGKTNIRYSLYFGNQENMIRTIYLNMIEGSSIYDVMTMAQTVDSTYNFIFSNESGIMYIYQIAGIPNDPEAGKYWNIFTGRSDMSGYLKHFGGNIKNTIFEDGDHLIMCYKNIHE